MEINNNNEIIDLFIKNQISENLKDFLDIFPYNQRINGMKKILSYYKNSIIIDNCDNRNYNSIIINNFYKSVELYFSIIDNYSEILSKKYEKN